MSFVFFFSPFYLTISHSFSQYTVFVGEKVHVCIFENGRFLSSVFLPYWVEHIQMFSYDTLVTYICKCVVTSEDLNRPQAILFTNNLNIQQLYTYMTTTPPHPPKTKQKRRC